MECALGYCGLLLPPLDGTDLCLPLSGLGALELAAALLAEGTDEALERLGALTRQEPGLALWVAERNYRRGGPSIATPAAAARWLVSHALAELADWNPGAPVAHVSLTALAKVAQSAADRWSAEPSSPGDAFPIWQLPAAMPAIETRFSFGVDVSWVPALVRRLARLERLERSFRSEFEAEKLAALKELAYGAGHEINNPLANISARAQTLLEDEHDPERRRRLAAINAQAFRAHEMIADLMLFARPPQLQPVEFDLAECVSGVVAALREQAAAQNTELAYAPPAAPLTLIADPTQISVAVHALAKNALEALGTGGRVTITVSWQADDGAGSDVGGNMGIAAAQSWARIVVADNGPGIPPEIVGRIFDPFFSGREAGRGLGFGLSKCWRIITAHGGRIEVASLAPHGAALTLWLPITGAESPGGALGKPR